MINLFRLTSFRLIFIYTILLVVSVFLIAFYLHLSTARDLKNRVDEDIIKESKMLIRVYQRGGVNRLARSIAQLSQIPNANLYALRNNNNDIVEAVDYLIVTSEEMLSQANRLAEINRDVNNLNVKVVDLKTIYNEFNSSNPDVSAIRNFVKYVYDNSDGNLKYLCLFGDASYDYKDRISNNTNIVPSWHSLSSFSLSSSFISDDFFGMMDLNEGTMSSSDKLDIAVGRILADSPQRAKELVDKILKEKVQ